MVRNEGTSMISGSKWPQLRALWGAGLSFSKCHAERRVLIDSHTLWMFDKLQNSRHDLAKLKDQADKASAIFNILVLLLVVYRNFQRGKIWIGDVFISFARTLSLRGLSIVGIRVMEGFWTLLTFALADGNMLSDGIGVFSFEQIIYGDLLTLYISLAGLLGYILRERINPALAVALFELGFQLRSTLIDVFPSSVRDAVVSYSQVDYLSGMAALPNELKGFSPFLFWPQRSRRAPPCGRPR